MVLIFPHIGSIKRFTLQISVFSPNVENGPEKLRIYTLARLRYLKIILATSLQDTLASL